MPEPAGTRVDLAGVAARFAELLHALGVEAGPDRAARFACSVAIARPVTTTDLYWLGRVTLAGSPVEIAAYDRAFADVFRGIADVADSRGDPTQPDLHLLERGAARREGADGADVASDGAPRPAPPSADAEHDEEDQDTEQPTGAPATGTELLRARDFSDCTLDELAALRRLVSELAVVTPRRPSRRRRRHRSGGDIDLRATLRHARRTGGHPAELTMRRATERRRRVVLIADVSGSMERYSRAYLYLLHGAVRALRAETFVFATQLTRLTPALRSGDPERALRAAVAEVGDWSGGTRIGAALATFNDGWGRRGLARGAVVVVVSDGWEGGDPALLGEQMARLSRLAHRIVWVNPRAKSDRYRPLVGGMAAALPYVDRFTSGHSLDALDDVLAAISAA